MKDEYFPCGRTGCAFCGRVNQDCRILFNFDEEYTRRCPFFKTLEQLTMEQDRAEKRLKRLGMK